MRSGMAGAERIFQLLDEKDIESEATELAVRDSEGPPDEAIALHHVSFAYKPGFPVLHDVTLTARRGEKIALVGATGAGKTTVASLVLRLYEATSGSVRVMGRDVRSYQLDALRAKLAVVPQDVFLFPGTVLSNIAMTDVESDGATPRPDRPRVERALERIGALDLFLNRPG